MEPGCSDVSFPYPLFGSRPLNWEQWEQTVLLATLSNHWEQPKPQKPQINVVYRIRAVPSYPWISQLRNKGSILIYRHMIGSIGISNKKLRAPFRWVLGT